QDLRLHVLKECIFGMRFQLRPHCTESLIKIALLNQGEPFSYSTRGLRGVKLCRRGEIRFSFFKLSQLNVKNATRHVERCSFRIPLQLRDLHVSADLEGLMVE